MTIAFKGESVKRSEDHRLITGEGTYVDDVRLPGLLHVAFVRSPHAHALIRGIDVSAAAAAPTYLNAVHARAVGQILMPRARGAT